MSGPEIDYNKLREGGLEYASNQLFDAAQVLAALLDLREPPDEIMRKHPMLVVGIALVAHLDERAEERRIMMGAALEMLRGISNSVEILAGGVMHLIIGELKERWLKTHQNYTEAELKEAMEYYDSMTVKGSGLKHDDK